MLIFAFRMRKLNRHYRGRSVKHQFVNKKGYFSETTNSLQLSIVNENHWIGEEVLVIKEQPYPYSVVTGK